MNNKPVKCPKCGNSDPHNGGKFVQFPEPCGARFIWLGGKWTRLVPCSAPDLPPVLLGSRQELAQTMEAIGGRFTFVAFMVQW